MLFHPKRYIDTHIAYSFDCNSLFFEKVYPY